MVCDCVEAMFCGCDGDDGTLFHGCDGAVFCGCVCSIFCDSGTRVMQSCWRVSEWMSCGWVKMMALSGWSGVVACWLCDCDETVFCDQGLLGGPPSV